jgi:hypothetical protein
MWLNLLAGRWTQRGKVVVLKVVVILFGIAARTWHGLRRIVARVIAIATTRDVGGRGSDLGVGSATASSHTWVDARHTKPVGTRQRRGKAVALVVLGRRSGLAVSGSAVVGVAREAAGVSLAVLSLKVE